MRVMPFFFIDKEARVLFFPAWVGLESLEFRKKKEKGKKVCKCPFFLSTVSVLEGLFTVTVF
jgi:hypothetical protein